MAEMSHGENSFLKRSQRSFDFHSRRSDQHQYLQEPSHVPYPWDYSHGEITASSRHCPSKEANHTVLCVNCKNRLKYSSKNACVGVNHHPRLCDNDACNFISNNLSAGPNLCISGHEFPKDKHKVSEIVSNAESYNFQAQTSVDRSNSSDDQILEKFTESPVTARIPSPGSVSSVTSGKRLEWDSGADVGYIFSHDTYPSSNENLSTIERLALVRGCSTALFRRLDPEGISGPPKPVPKFQNTSVSFNSPVANSTPLSRSEDLSTKSTKQTIPEVEPVETSVLPGGFLYLHCDQEFENDVAPGGERNSRRNKCSNKNKSVANMCKKLSNSLIDLRTDQQGSTMSSSLPRSQSVLNLTKEGDQHQTDVKDQFKLLQTSRTIAATCSVSTSSVATIVQKPVVAMTSDKNIQTLPLKLSVGVQVSENLAALPSASGQEIDSINRAENVSNNKTSNNGTQSNSLAKNSKGTSDQNNFPKSDGYVCSGAHKKDSLDSVLCASRKIQNPPLSFNFVRNVMSEVLSHVSNKENLELGTSGETQTVSDREISTSASGSNYSQTGESSSGLSVPHLETSVLNDGVHGSTGVVGSANSFEYLPGEIFERSFPSSSEACRKSTDSPNPSSQTNSSSPVANDFIKSRNDSDSSTLKKSVEEGVVLLKKLISGKSMNGKMKKKLIQEIVNKLVDSDHNDEPHSRSGSIQSNKHSISTDNPNAVITNVLKQHLGSGDWAEESSRHIANESSDRSLKESATHSSELRNTSQCSETSQNHRLNSSCTPSGSVSVPGDDEQSPAESSQFSSSNVSKSSRQNWKIPTSRAEKIFQSKREEFGESSSYTPPLLKLCKTEHIKQLEWIKFEINHLTHLKQLLEKQEGITKSLSKLTVHENKLHKLRKDYSKPSHSGKLERNNHQDSNSKHKNRMNESGTSYSSGNAGDQNFLERRREEEERNSEDTNKLESPTHSSYILSHPNKRSNKNGIAVDDMKNRRGHLNVFTETFPKPRENIPQFSVKPGSYVNSDVSKQQHLETAFKCCCECKKALEAIALREKQNPTLSQQHVHQFCRCHFMSTHPLPEEISQDYSDDSSRRDMREFVKHPEVNHARCKFCNGRENVCSFGCVHTCPKHSKEYETTVSKSGSTVENKVTCSDAVVQASIKEPLAYVLTFEPSSYDNRVKRNSLPEIKLMVPPSINEKKKKIGLKKPIMAMMDSDSYKENQCPIQSKHSEPEEHNKSVHEINPSEQDQPLLDNKLSDTNQPVSDTSKKSSKLTLQEYLKANRPDYVKLADKRSQCLADLAVLRDMRKQKRRELLKMTFIPESTEAKDTSDEKATRISERATVASERATVASERATVVSERATGTSDKATVTSDRATVTSVSGKRLFSSRTIREQTRKKYMRTKEVQNKLAERKKKEESRANRLMVELFTKNLQKRALQGIVNHSYSASLSSAG